LLKLSKPRNLNVKKEIFNTHPEGRAALRIDPSSEMRITGIDASKKAGKC